MKEASMDNAQRSGCPINLALEVLGDKWSLLVLRDIVFADRRYFRQLLKHSPEGIASNVLADRFKRLLDRGVLTKSGDADHKQKARYSLTAMGIALVPVLAELGIWGRHHLHADELLSVGAKVLESGGASARQRLMQELRDEHLASAETAPKRTRRQSVRGRIQQAYQALVEAGPRDVRRPKR
jgi:DNA-binding HxlR family transcriptional regulator